MTTAIPMRQPTRRRFLKTIGSFAGALTFLPSTSRGDEGKNLTLYNWDTYTGKNTLSDFKKATGITVKMDLFADQAELLAKIEAGHSGYDVIVPSNDSIERLIQLNLLLPWTTRKSPTCQTSTSRSGMLSLTEAGSIRCPTRGVPWV